MSAHADALAHGLDARAPRAAAANHSSRIDPTILGILLFIGSEAMLFGSFFAALFFVRVVNPNAPSTWPPAAVRVPGLRRGREHGDPRHVQLHGALGHHGDERNDRNGLKAGLLLTIFLGTAFLLTQFVEYAHIGFNTATARSRRPSSASRACTARTWSSGSRCSRSPPGAAFSGHFSPEHHHGLEIPAIYWHFVDVMWIVVSRRRLPPLSCCSGAIRRADRPPQGNPRSRAGDP